LEIKKRNPKILTRALLRGRQVNLVDIVQAAQADAVSLSYDYICHEDVEKLRSAGISIALCEMWQPDFEYALQYDIDILSWGNPQEARKALNL
jgi:hypothetical protein